MADKYIVIGGLVWKVYFVDGEHKAFQDVGEGKVQLGVTFYTDCIIYINNELSYSLQKQTLVHELLHAAFFSFGYTRIRADVATEEEICDAVSCIFEIVNKKVEEIMKDRTEDGVQ